MKFGQKIRDLRRTKKMGQRALADAVGVSHTYISKIENHRLDFGDYPSNELIVKLAEALDADPDELLVLAEKVPEPIRQRVLERPEAFRKLAALDDKTLDGLLTMIPDCRPVESTRKRR
jgi:HTH-type transcriptional regulator, competence development regulator